MRTHQPRAITAAISMALMCLVALPVSLLSSCEAQAPNNRRPQQETGADQEREDLRSVVERLDADIALLNRINRLSLSKAQAETLISIARSIQSSRRTHQQQMDPVRAELLPLLKEKIGYMMRDERIPDELQAKIAEVRSRLNALADQCMADSLNDVQRARNTLTEPQLLIITGGDQARQAAREMLIWLRELSAQDFNSEAMLNAEQLADPSVNLDVDTVYETFKTARNLTTEEYHDRAPELAAKLAPLFRTGTMDEDIILLELLTNERFVPVMQRRAQYLSDGGGAG
jgi:hypothetical protein